MFGFGNSKQKKYKKALEEFLQKMMSVKDYFEIIQARGKGQSQMAEMLGVKVSDTDYWAKEHYEEYKSRFSQSNDPLSDIELRFKNYSFIKKEMEGFINYAKELEMNLTQGFVDDYYATVATCKSLDKCKEHFKSLKDILELKKIKNCGYNLDGLGDFLFKENISFDEYLNQFMRSEDKYSSYLASSIHNFIKINEDYHERNHGPIKSISEGVFKIHQALCKTLIRDNVDPNTSLESSFLITDTLKTWIKKYIEKSDSFYFDFITQPKVYVEGYLKKIINSFDECFLEKSSFVPKNDIDKIFIFNIRSMKKISLELLIRDVRQRED